MRGIAASLLLAACSSAAPSWRTAPAPAAPVSPVSREPAAARTGARVAVAAPQPVTFAPDSAPAVRYNEPAAAPLRSALGDAVIAAVRDAAAKAKLAIPVPDARLFRTCAELAAVVPEEGIVNYSLVEFALQRNGIIEPSPHLLVVWGDLSSPELIAQDLAPMLGDVLREGALTRLGVGAVRRKPDGTGAMVFALQSSGVSTRPIPRAVPEGGSIAIDAVVDPRYRDPEVFVTYEGGDTQRIDLRPGRPGGFDARVPCAGHTGKQQIEITASDAAGSTVLANFPVWCGAVPPLTATVESVRGGALEVSTQEAERELWADVNRDRAAANLPALVWDESLAQVARAHSDEMRRTHVVAHISPTTGSASDRVRAAGIRTGVVLENVARAYGIAEAHSGLMNSPGHRANLMSAVATQIGIGIAYGDEVSGQREVFVTQVFTRIPPRIDPIQAVASVRGKLAAARPVPSAPALDVLAQRLASGLAAGKSADAAYQTIGSDVSALGDVYQRVGSVITAVAELDKVDGAGLLGTVRADAIGLGVAQGPHPVIGDNALWIVVLYATRRKE